MKCPEAQHCNWPGGTACEAGTTSLVSTNVLLLIKIKALPSLCTINIGRPTLPLHTYPDVASYSYAAYDAAAAPWQAMTSNHGAQVLGSRAALLGADLKSETHGSSHTAVRLPHDVIGAPYVVRQIERHSLGEVRHVPHIWERRREARAD